MTNGRLWHPAILLGSEAGERNNFGYVIVFLNANCASRQKVGFLDGARMDWDEPTGDLHEIKGGKRAMKKKVSLLLIIFTFCLATSVNADQATGKVFLIHAKTSLKLDDAQICAVPNVAMAALRKGYQVVILFDASGITAIKKGGFWGGENTPLDKARLPDRERRTLAAQFGIAIDSVPHDYGEYVRFLKNRYGVSLYANRTMMLLYKIGEGEIDSAVTPVGLEKMVEILESASVYVAY